MRSEKLAAMADNLTPGDLGPIHNRARDEVLRKGKETDKEHGVAVLADGTTVSFGGEYENRLDVPVFEAPTGSVTIHHNHPSGDSFSRADLRLLLERPDIGRVDAHGHDGLWASSERIAGSLARQQAMLAIENAASQESVIAKMLKRRELDDATGQAGLWQVVMSLMLEKQGLLRCSLNSESVKALAKKVAK